MDDILDENVPITRRDLLSSIHNTRINTYQHASTRIDMPSERKSEIGEGSEATATTSSLTLHDYLSLGEVHRGLQDSNHKESEEIQRLPYLLRLLSATRSHDSATNENTHDGKQLLRDTVESLEQVAATHSEAEAVEVVACYLAPHVTKRISRLPRVKGKTSKDSAVWYASQLKDAAKNPVSSSKDASKGKSKRQRLEQDGGGGGSGGGGSGGSHGKVQSHSTDAGKQPSAGSNAGDNDHGDYNDNDNDHDNDDDYDASSTGGESDGENQDSTNADEKGAGSQADKGKSRAQKASAKRKRRRSESRTDSGEAQDSKESIVIKTLSDLASLVASALANADSISAHKDGSYSITMEDSVLAESSSADAGDGTDAAFTISSLLHHAPILRSRHVAMALCRTELPQIDQLLMQIVSNSPISISGIICGCLDAHAQAKRLHETTIMTTSSNALRTIASLSPTACSMVQNAVNQTNGRALLALRLELSAMNGNAVNVATAAIHNLSNRHDGQPSNAVESNDPSPPDNPEDQDQAVSTTDTSEPSIHKTLSDSSALVKSLLALLLQAIADGVGDGAEIKASRGELSLLLRGFGLLLVHVGSQPLHAHSSSSSNNRANYAPPMVGIDFLLKFQGIIAHLTKLNCEATRLIELVLACASLAFAATFSADLKTSTENATRIMDDALQQLHTKSRALWMHSTGARFLYFGLFHTKYPDISLLVFRRLVKILIPQHNVSNTDAMFELWKSDFPSLRQNVEQAGQDDTDGSLHDCLALQLSIARRELEQPANGQTEMHQRVSPVLKHLLSSAMTIDMSQAEKEWFQPTFGREVTSFTIEATNALFNEEATKVPMVLPLDVDTYWYHMNPCQAKSATTKAMQIETCHALLQLLHALLVLRNQPRSPFAIEPHMLPINSIVNACKSLRGCDEWAILADEVLGLLASICPHSVQQYDRWELLTQQTYFDAAAELPGELLTAKHLASALKTSLSDDHASDISDSQLECMFLRCRMAQSDQAVCEALAKVFLEYPRSSLRHYSYSLLVKDPIVLLKCSTRIWRRSGLRRLCVRVLMMLCETNETLTLQKSPSLTIAQEMIAARDDLLVRCLIILLSVPRDDGPPIRCSLTQSFIRSKIAQRPGIVAVLVKQGMQEDCVDWIVAHVPESMHDHHDLRMLLSDQSSLTPVEKLVAGDAVMRIAVAHGDADDKESGALCYAALSQLIQCFFLILGPIGVPVNALIRDEGEDVTQIARKAAFRILRALLKVRGPRKQFRAECGGLLNRLSTMCKSENLSMGLGGAVAGRRKMLIRDLHEAISRAASALGLVLA